MKKLQSNQSGFTIIEVLIVLAIAGLIMLIVFLAVPALQRNSRNNSRRNDVAKLLGAVQEQTNTNNGSLPLCTGVFETFTATKNNTQLSLYKAADVTCGSGAGVGYPASVDSVVIAMDATCPSGFSVTTTAKTRSVAALYRIETGSGNATQCQNS